MDWTQFLRGDMGWAATVGIVVYVSRLIINGNLILKREYDSLLIRAESATEKAEEAVLRQSEASTKTIEAQAEVIKMQQERIEGGR